MRRFLSVLSVSMLVCGAAEAANCVEAQRGFANEYLLALQADPISKAELAAKHAPFGFHRSGGRTKNEELLFHQGYVSNHDGDLRTTLWVSYQLTADDVRTAEVRQRINCFRADPRLKAEFAAVASDYEEDTFDQGHMANDADIKDVFVEQLNTYVYSNMSPQHCRFNRGIWLSLEGLVRIWAEEHQSLNVTSGAIFDRDGTVGRDKDNDAIRMLSRNGKKRVAVPSAFYKVIVRRIGDQWHSVSMLLEHNNKSHGTKWESVSPSILASVETLEVIEKTASIKLLPGLKRSKIVQNDLSKWDMSKGIKNLEPSPPDKCIQ